MIYTPCMLRCATEHRHFLPQLPLRNSDADFEDKINKNFLLYFCVGCLGRTQRKKTAFAMCIILRNASSYT